MKNILIIVDMQKDFVDGALGTKEAVAIVPNVCEYINQFDGDIFVTLDTHYDGYMNTSEGKNLPVPHCIKGTEGHKLDENVLNALGNKSFEYIEKITFGSIDLPEILKAKYGDDFTVTLLGLCTDICVISNALILKANFPENEISVVENCCAGVTPEKHNCAIETMKSCQIKVI
ncbi:MAG: cysteine hydrolase [Clostridia bacterium]|nr:cysteine hydrolase [Clostridia bacterium]